MMPSFYFRILIPFLPAVLPFGSFALAQPAPESHPTSRFVDVNGVEIHYVDEGAGDPILFIHGNPDNLYTWRNILPYAAQVGRAVAFDLAGMGKSGIPEVPHRFTDHARNLEEFIDAIKLENVVLVGHDWGGALAFHYASRHEDKVRGIVFMETGLGPVPGWESFPEPARELFQQLRIPELGHALIVEQNVLGDGPRTIRTLSDAELDLYRNPLEDPARRVPVLNFARDIPVAGEPAWMHEMMENHRHWLQQTPIPKLLAYTTPGLIISETQVAWCRENLDSLTTIDLGDGFHYPHEENPAALGEALVDWLRTKL